MNRKLLASMSLAALVGVSCADKKDVPVFEGPVSHAEYLENTVSPGLDATFTFSLEDDGRQYTFKSFGGEAMLCRKMFCNGDIVKICPRSYKSQGPVLYYFKNTDILEVRPGSS